MTAQAKPLPYANKGNLTEGPVSGHLIRLTIPMIWGIMAIISFQLVDTYYVSLLGTEELAALSFTFPLNYMIFSFIMGFGIAMSSVVSRLIGANDKDTVRRVVGHGLLLVSFIGLILAALGLTLHDWIFRTMGADEAMTAKIWEYMSIWFAGAIFISLPMVGNSAIRAGGDSLTPALIMGLVALINVILDPILIFGLFGFPRLELQGAAIATVSANAIAAMAGIYVLIFKKKLLCWKATCRFHEFGNSCKRLLIIALPAGLTSAIHPFVSAIILSLLAVYGTEAVAAFGIVSRLEAFAFIILMALSTGMAPIIGQNWGAEKYERVHKTLKLAIGFNVIWSAFIAVIFGLFAKSFAEIFSDNEQIIHIAALYFWIVPVTYILGNLLKGWGSAFNAMGMPQKSLMLVVFEMIILMIPAVYIGQSLGDIKGIFIAMAAVNVITGIVTHFYGNYTCRKNEHTS